MDLLTCLSEEPPANRSVSQDFGEVLMTRVGISCSPTSPLLAGFVPAGSSGKTFRACFPATKDGILEPSSQGWGNSGMGSRIGLSTLNTCEWTATIAPSRSDDAVCSLSDILETGDVPQRYYLTAKACRGILRRAEKRGKVLPEPLARALMAVAGSEQISN